MEAEYFRAGVRMDSRDGLLKIQNFTGANIYDKAWKIGHYPQHYNWLIKNPQPQKRQNMCNGFSMRINLRFKEILLHRRPPLTLNDMTMKNKLQTRWGMQENIRHSCTSLATRNIDITQPKDSSCHEVVQTADLCQQSIQLKSQQATGTVGKSTLREISYYFCPEDEGSTFLSKCRYLVPPRRWKSKRRCVTLKSYHKLFS